MKFTSASGCVIASGLLLAAAQASAVTITFDDLAVGTTLSAQYTGVTFSANAFTGPGSSTSGAKWATNTDMTIVSSTGSDVGGLGTPLLASGNLLRSFAGWLGEDGDPSFKVTFVAPITSFGATFAGVAAAADVTLFAYNGSTLLGTVSGTSTNQQFVLSFSAPSITSVAVRPGSFNDWVGVDNITYTPAAVVPELNTYAMMGLGMALLAFKRRKAA